MRRRALIALIAVSLAACVPAVGTTQPAPPATSDLQAPLLMEEGTWDADVTFYADDKPSGSAKGVQINTFLANRHWMVNELKVPGDGRLPPYEGHGVWGYDPVARTYVNTWVDTSDLAVRTDYGFWYEPEKTMVWSSKQNDGEGHFIDYRTTEEFKGDTRVFTFFQLGLAKPSPHPLVKIVFTRQKAPSNPKNVVGQSPGEPNLEETLISLEKQSWAAWKQRDGNFFAGFLSEDHVDVGFGGVTRKAAVVAGVSSPSCVVESYALDGFNVMTLDPTSALVTYRAEQKTTCGGAPVPSPTFVSSLYMKRGDRWRNVLFQQTQATRN